MEYDLCTYFILENVVYVFKTIFTGNIKNYVRNICSYEVVTSHDDIHFVINSKFI